MDSNNKKKVVFLFDLASLKKKLNQNWDADRLSVGVVEFMMMRAWFGIKYGVLCIVFYKIKRKKNKRGGGG